MVALKNLLACVVLVFLAECAASCPYCPPNSRCILGICICKGGYIWKKGECVEQCISPKIYKRCPTSCPQTCDQPELRPCNRGCRVGVTCVCPEGYVEISDKNHNCIKKEGCPKKCPGIKIFKACPTACPDTCDNHGQPRICPAVCRPGINCVCPLGYVERSATDTTCVKIEDCKEKCPDMKIFNPCPTACPVTCDNPKPAKICPTVCRPGVTCVCPPGYLERSKTDRTCVKPSKCKKTCPGIKIYKACPTACPDTCDNHGQPRICPAVCRPGINCVCPLGYVERSATDTTCVKPRDCKEYCPDMKIFNPCPTACPATCDDPNPIKICPTVCRPGVNCVCPPGYLEKSKTDTKCVKEENCKGGCKKCGINGHCKNNKCICRLWYVYNPKFGCVPLTYGLPDIFGLSQG